MVGQFDGAGFFEGIAAVERWPEQCRVNAELSFEHALGGIQFNFEIAGRNLQKIGMGIGVVADIMPAGANASKSFRVFSRIAAKNKKGGLG